MDEFLKNWRLPDDELMDLIENAFLSGAIDGVTASLAYSWLEVHEQTVH